MTLRRIQHAILTLIAAASLGHAGTNAWISAFGAWPLCVNGALGAIPGILADTCSRYVPGAETYSLNIRTDSPATSLYSWDVTVVLKDGSTKTVEGTAPRKDDKTTGYTEIPNVVFGGIVARVLSIGITEQTAMPAPAAAFAYVPAGSAGVSVVDTAANTVTTTIPTASPALGIAIAPDGKFAWVSESAADGSASQVEVIATATNTVAANIPLNSASACIAVSPDGKSVYVCNPAGNTVSVIATGANSVVARIPAGLRPTSVVFSPDGSSAWVANPDSSTVSVIDTATNTLATTISSAGSYPDGLAVSPAGSVVFVSGADGISAIDIATRTVVASVSMPGSPLGLAVSPDGAFLYRTSSNSGGSFLSVLKTAGYTVVTTINQTIVGDPRDLRASPDGAYLYVSYNNPAGVSVLSTATYSLASRFSTPGPAGPVAFAPLSNAVIAPALVTLHPATVAGGTSATGYVVLTGAAPAGGATVSLSSNDSSVTVPASVIVPAGAKTASFNITTQPVSSAKSVNISAVYNTLSKSAVFTFIPTAAVTVSSVSVNPAAIVGGDLSTGTVTLTVPAPAGGVTVDLWTNGSPAFVPASATIPAGSTSATFPVTTNFVAAATPGTITAFLNGASATTAVSVMARPAVASVSVNPGTVPNSGSATGTVTLTGSSPAGGTVVQLWTNGWPVFVPMTVTIPAGSLSATFAVTTSYVTTTTQGTITAFLNGKSVTTTLTVLMSPVLASVYPNAPAVAGSSSAAVSLTLSSAAPAGGVVVQLWTSGFPLSVPASVTFNAGSSTATFVMTTGYVATPTQGTITAFLNGQSLTATVTVVPVALASVSMNATTWPGGTAGTGTVTLTFPAPAGGEVVQLWTNGSPGYIKQTSIAIPSGATEGHFDFQTDIVASPRVSTITAFLNGQSVTTTLTVMPPITLASVSVSPPRVPGSVSATGTVTLSKPVPATGAGILVWLWTNGSPAFVPEAVTVPPGANSVTFPVTTNYVTTSTQGTITAYLNGQSVTATITVTP